MDSARPAVLRILRADIGLYQHRGFQVTTFYRLFAMYRLHGHTHTRSAIRAWETMHRTL
jgi:hypothetical protein